MTIKQGDPFIGRTAFWSPPGIPGVAFRVLVVDQRRGWLLGPLQLCVHPLDGGGHLWLAPAALNFDLEASPCSQDQ